MTPEPWRQRACRQPGAASQPGKTRADGMSPAPVAAPPRPGILALARYRVTYEALEPLDLPAYLGSTLRGAFGRAFRQLCCPARLDEPCPIPASCPYHLVFETSPPPGAEALSTHDEIPRPFVIGAPPASAAEHPAGSDVAFDLTLVGRAREFFPHFVVTLREVDGIGRGRRAVTLSRVDAVHPLSGAQATAYSAAESLVRPRDLVLTLADCAAVPAPARGIRVGFVTQARLTHEGRIARRPDFHVFFRRLLGRLSSLARFHCGGPLDVDFRGLIEQAQRVRLVADHTRWTAWTRYSGRQDRRMEWTGIVGEATYEGDLAPFWPYLVFGQWTHVGKGATFGLGNYRIASLDGEPSVWLSR
jgi:hypothetical protein